MKRISLLFSVLSLTATLSFSQSSGKLNLQKGQKLDVTTKSSSTITQEMMGQVIEITADVNSLNAVAVNDIASGNYDLTNTLLHIDFNASAMGRDMSYNSDKKEDRDGEMGASFKDLLNSPKKFTLTANGKLQSMEKKKSEQDAMMMGMSGDPSKAIETTFLILPNTQTGFSWTDSSTEGITKKTMTYTVREIKDKDAIIDIKGVINTSGTNEVMGNEVKVSTKGTAVGDQTLDLETGIVKDYNLTVESKGTSEIMGQEIPISSKVITKTTVTPSK